MPTAYPETGPLNNLPPPAGGARLEVEADPIRKMLPIESPRILAPLDGFAPALTADGRETKFMDLEEEAGKNEQRWADLPHPYWGVVGQAKPAAATLAFAPDGPADPLDPTARERKQRPDRPAELRTRQGAIHRRR